MSSLVAAASTSGGTGNLLIFVLPVLLIVWMFISQRRRAKETQKLQSSLGIGDDVSTTSGLLGRITAQEDGITTLEVSPGVSIRFVSRAIAGPAPTRAATEPTSSGPVTDTEPDSAPVAD